MAEMLQKTAWDFHSLQSVFGKIHPKLFGRSVEGLYVFAAERPPTLPEPTHDSSDSLRAKSNDVLVGETAG